jgi:hypothetical protein
VSNLPYAISLPHEGKTIGVIIANISNMRPHKDNPNHTMIHTTGGGFVFVDLPVAEIVERINTLLDGEDDV